MLPIRKVVLYKHGVGYFERQGEVEGDAALDLHFRASEMNDVLKSLTTLDLTSGHIASISYESTKPLAQQLEDIAIRLPDKNAVSGLLGDIQGAHLAVEIAGERIEGVASGIETVRRHVEDAVVERPHLALLVDGTALRSFDLQEVSRIEFLDDGLRADLQHLLQVLIDAKKKDRKRLTIYAQGQDKRQILASYIVETPVWKTSYRVLLGGDAPVIQGWALVDNTQDEDWVDVNLSLVAGLPISFVHDLYSPRYRRRPVVEVEEEEAYAPPILEQATAGYAMDELAEAADAAPPPPMPAARSRKRMSRDAERIHRALLDQRAEARTRSVDVQTRTAEVGDLFEYAIENPVTVKRNQSALVPILQGPFDGRRVAVYNADVREKNPMSAVLFHNTTGMTLEGGPLTVLEDETYVGESMLDTLKPDEERLVPYSVELGCVVTTDPRTRHEDVRATRIVDGALRTYRYRRTETTYVVVNKTDKPIDLFLEHRFRHGWDLIDTTDPVERTDNFYRFRFPAGAKQTVEFTVRERGDEERDFALLDIDRDTIQVWLTRRYIDGEVRAALEGLLERQARMADLERRIGKNEEQVGEVVADQTRQRENLKALGDSQQERELRTRYVAVLTEGEERIRSLRSEVAAWKTEVQEIEADLRTRVDDLEFEATL